MIWAGTLCGGFGDVIAATSAISQWPSTPQDAKDDMLHFLDTEQQALTNTARNLTQLGPPGITGGKQAQDIALDSLTVSAEKVSDQRAQLAALDANDTDFAQKVSQLLSPGFGAPIQQREMTHNQDLKRTFDAVPECQRLPR